MCKFSDNKSNGNEASTLENGNTTQRNNAQPNNPKQTLSQEQKVNLENLKWKEFTIINKHWMENSYDGNV